MKLEHIIGGLRSWLDDITTPIACSILAAQFLIDERSPPAIQYGFGCVLVVQGISNIMTYNDVAVRIAKKKWDEDLLRTRLHRFNTYHYVRRHPEHREAYRDLIRRLQGERA